MYLDSKDFQTVWRLAHNWVGADADSSDPVSLSPELKDAIHRLMSAAINRAIPIRTRRFIIFMDDSAISLMLDFLHLRRFWKCLRKDVFDKAYLDSIYMKRSDVLRWCQNEFLPPPPIWRVQDAHVSVSSHDSDEDEPADWYNDLTEKRKLRIACLEMAKKLWRINPEQSYEEVYRHPIMKQYGNPEVFSLSAFKRWARPFAPDAAKTGGKPKEINKYDALIKR